METDVTPAPENPLKEMKRRSKKPARIIAAEIQAELGEQKRDLTSVTKFIRVGGYKSAMHRAFAHAVNAKVEEVAAAAEELARRNKEKKSISQS